MIVAKASELVFNQLFLLAGLHGLNVQMLLLIMRQHRRSRLFYLLD